MFDPIILTLYLVYEYRDSLVIRSINNFHCLTIQFVYQNQKKEVSLPIPSIFIMDVLMRRVNIKWNQSVCVYKNGVVFFFFFENIYSFSVRSVISMLSQCFGCDWAEMSHTHTYKIHTNFEAHIDSIHIVDLFKGILFFG